MAVTQTDDLTTAVPTQVGDGMQAVEFSATHPKVVRALQQLLAVRVYMSVRTSFVVYLLQALVLRNAVQPQVLALWGLGLAACVAVHFGVAWKLHRCREDDAQRVVWVRAIVGSLALVGLGWGVVVALPGVRSDTVLLLVSVHFMAVVGNFSVHNLCFDKRCLLAYSGGLVVPMVALAATGQDQVEMYLAMGLVIMTAMMQLYGYMTRKVHINDICGRLVAEHLAQQLQARNNELNEAMEHIHRMASIDPLTQCLNRRSMVKAMQREHARQSRYGTQFGLIMVDLDNFKSINDSLGHAAGDKVLVAAAQRLRSELREVDRLARWGGEEFLCMVTHVSPADLLAKAESLCAALAAQPLVVPPQVAQPLTVTASLGVAMCQPDQSLDDALELADKAMYRAKAGGRNRVCGAVAGVAATPTV